MSRQIVVSKVEDLAQRAGGQLGLEVVEVELKGTGRNHLLRILIDKPEGVTHEDCELMSHRVGELLDAEDPIPGHYTLEVSSPGVERKLRKPADFERFAGQSAKIVLREPLDGKKMLEGTLRGLSGETVAIDVKGETIAVPLAQIDRANLKFDW